MYISFDKEWGITMAIIDADVCNGKEYTVYFDNEAICDLVQVGDAIKVAGNRKYLKLLARQMVYFSSNDHCLPFGSHAHYDPYDHAGFRGLELILEVIRAPRPEIILDGAEGLQVNIPVPQDRDMLYENWEQGSKVSVAQTNVGAVYLLGNAKGLRFVATVLLCLAENGKPGDSFICNQQLLAGWEGKAIQFELM